MTLEKTMITWPYQSEEVRRMERIVIHRDRTFTYDGLTFVISGGNAYGGNAGWCYEVYEKQTQARVNDNYDTLAQIRKQFPEDYACEWQDEHKRPVSAPARVQTEEGS